ncbi:prepilin peptidase, partial [Vibrio cholerae]
NFLVTSPGRSIAENFSHWFSKNKLCKNEINTLLGLMVKKPLTKLAITQEEIDKLANDSDSLLEELHNSMLFNPSAIEALFSDMDSSKGFGERFMSSPASIRESTFYSADSAYDFQYNDLSIEKYIQDEEWILKNKGFTVRNAVNIVNIIKENINEKASRFYKKV